MLITAAPTSSAIHQRSSSSSRHRTKSSTTAAKRGPKSCAHASRCVHSLLRTACAERPPITSPLHLQSSYRRRALTLPHEPLSAHSLALIHILFDPYDSTCTAMATAVTSLSSGVLPPQPEFVPSVSDGRSPLSPTSPSSTWVVDEYERVIAEEPTIAVAVAAMQALTEVVKRSSGTTNTPHIQPPIHTHPTHSAPTDPLPCHCVSCVGSVDYDGVGEGVEGGGSAVAT